MLIKDYGAFYSLQVVDTEHVNVQIQPGQYVVTAHERNTGQIQTHIINVEHGQSVNLDFTV